MDNNLVLQGVELMLLGMGIVFSFLTLLVFTLRGMSLLADRFEASETAQSETTAAAPVDVSDDQQLVAVISAAVARYRADRAR